MLRRRTGLAGSLPKDPPAVRDSFAEAYGREYLDFLLKLDVKAVKKEAEAILDRLVADTELAKVSYERGNKTRTVGEAAHAELFEIRHLQPGKPVPEIEGEDIDGQRFRLSDYRGKVGLLDFWETGEAPAGPCTRTSGRS